MLQNSPAPGFVMDLASFESMKARVRQSPAQTEAEVAQQFEGLLTQMMLRSMRDASFKSGLFDSQQTRLMQSLHDEQLSLQMSQTGNGLGIANMLVEQMRRVRESQESALQMASTPGVAEPASLGGIPGVPALLANAPVSATLPTQWRSTVATPASGVAGLLDSIRSGVREVVRQGAEVGKKAAADVPAHVDVFVRRLLPEAERVAETSGLPLRLILGQAALESGWGKQEIRHGNGTPSYNLFGIKATKDWGGKTAAVVTTEYIDGQPQKLTQTFRAYRSYEEGLSDYARLLTENPRYQKVATARSDTEAARRVQEAGYATDPNYASKLIAVMRALPL